MMKSRNRTGALVPTVATVMAMASGCGRAAPTVEAPAPRPVSVMELREIDPVKPMQITGSVHPWKEQDVAFEVSGRVIWVVEQGKTLEGRWEEDGAVIVAGDVLARVDDATYQASLIAAKAELEYAKITHAKVLPAELAEAEANLVNRQAEFDKIMSIPESAVEPIELIRVRGNRDMAVAQAERAQAALSTGQASVDKAKAALLQAELDVQHSTLYAPFSSEVSKVYVEAGGYLAAGQPVAHLVMMDPIKVDVAVSPDTARNLDRRETVQLYLPGQAEPVYGHVYEKATVADPDTRTMRVSIITRNRRSTTAVEEGQAVISKYIYCSRRWIDDDTSPLVVEENRALRHDSTGYYVWAAPDRKPGVPTDPDDRSVTLRRIDVVPGDERLNFQGLYLFRTLADPGELEVGTLVALDVPDNFEDGQKVIITTSDWTLRPGQMVPVLLAISPPASGMYVPMNAILHASSQSDVVFIEKDGLAHRVEIRVLGSAGELIHIGPLDEEPTLLQPGANIILDYIHFLQDREPVRVIRRRELPL